MSRKGAPSACKSKQIPRIFRGRRGLCSARIWTNVEVGATGGTSNYAHTELLSTPSVEDKRGECNKKEKAKAGGNDAIAGYAERSWSADTQVNNSDTEARSVDSGRTEKTADVETVADIEKWLKTRTESVSSMDLDAIKSEVGEGVDQYLGDELPHGFLGKDPDALSIDIDLSDKKLNLGYDPILQDLQSEKLLEACEKDDEFILPEFQLDHLDPLSLSPDDMMVAGEILPSTSAQPSLNVSNDPEIEIKAEVVTRTASKERDPCSKTDRVVVDNLESNLENVNNVDNVQQQEKANAPSSEETGPYTVALTSENAAESYEDAVIEILPEFSIIEQLKSKAKIRLEPRIIKKRRKMSERFEKNLDKHVKSGNFVDTQDGVMAVVAISTDKISNMTQIVINTGTEEQIYQGKTSELIKATGNFPKLPKLESTSTWSNNTECTIDNAPNNQHEMVISNALEELGITDDNLQSISVTDHGTVWPCPREDCNRQFNRLYALKVHLLAHYGVRPFKCDIGGCTWAFYSEYKLKRHKETHLKRKDYVCEVDGCNRRFTTVYNLWTHEKLHSRPNRIVCQVPNCQEKFQTKRALELHMKSHDQSHALHVCKHEGCGKRFYTGNALTSHQRCHSYKEVDVKCSWPGCGKVFDKPCRLKAHIRSHTGCKPYLCTFQGCQSAFSSSSKLRRHQKKHTNERKFVCDVASCGKAFMRSEHLKEHRLTHKEGRFFRCCNCDARFSAKSSLYVHIKKVHQSREDEEANSYDSSKQRSEVNSKESHCSRVKPVVKSKRKSTEVNVETTSPVLSITEQPESDDTNVEISKDPNADETILQDPLGGPLYHCPVETCTKSYNTKATLRAHMLKAHDTAIKDCDKLPESVSTCAVSNMDYILYTAPSAASEPSEQMIMFAPWDAVIVSTTPEADCILPDPEPPPLNALMKSSETPNPGDVQQQTCDESSKKDQGSARTGLTFSDVWKLKANGALVDSVVGASDVVFGTSDSSEGLLLTEELPSMYYQDDVVGTEYQVLLLDSGQPESTINLRGLE